MKKRTAFLALVIVLIAIASFFLWRETNLSPSTAHPSPTAPISVPVHPPPTVPHTPPSPTPSLTAPISVPVHPPPTVPHTAPISVPVHPPPTVPQSPSAATGISVTVQAFSTAHFFEIGSKLILDYVKDYNNILRATKQDNASGLKNYKVTYAGKTWTLNGAVSIFSNGVVYIGITNGPYHLAQFPGPYTLTFYAPS